MKTINKGIENKVMLKIAIEITVVCNDFSHLTALAKIGIIKKLQIAKTSQALTQCRSSKPRQ